jgi:imidazolonepropionase-like amidohydrolase
VTVSLRSRRGVCSVLAFVLLLSGSGCKPPEEANVKAIVGAVLVDGTGGPPVSNSIVMISGSRIVAAGPRTAFVIPQGTEEIDGSGKYIIPALINVYMRSGDGVIALVGGQTALAGVIAPDVHPVVARVRVGEFAAARYYMALLDGVPPAVEEAVLDEARKNKLPVFARVNRLTDAQRLVTAGVAGFVGMITDTDQIDAAFLARMRDLRMIWVPLLSEQPAAGLETAKRNTQQMASAGVPIAVGGPSIEREMELLVEAGMSPGDAIVAATRNGAVVARKSLERGTLQFGRSADLWMLPKNPIEDIRNLRTRGREMIAGAWFR